jgi:hypothetical protein
VVDCIEFLVILFIITQECVVCFFELCIGVR